MAKYPKLKNFSCLIVIVALHMFYIPVFRTLLHAGLQTKTHILIHAFFSCSRNLLLLSISILPTHIRPRLLCNMFYCTM